MTTIPDHAALERAWSGRPGLPGWLTAVNHKVIGLRFVWTAAVFLLIGGGEALLIRLQLARPDGTILGPEAYNQVFTMHGTTMMFLFAVPILEGLAMYVVPLQIGARDMPLPRLNAFGYWVYLLGGLLLHVSFLTGQIPDGGWFAYTPLTGPEFSAGRGIDFWLLGVTFVEISGIVGALEIVVLVLRFRAPGMTLGRVPLFTWSALIMAGMMLFAFPFVVAASLLLEIERKTGAPFYDPAGGGDPLLWQHMFWIFGHPEVYIMLLPAIGIVSAVVATQVRRPIVGYGLVVASLAGIAIASFGLWVHHMFAVGLPLLVLSLFGIASYFIAVPSGIQVFAWIATIWEGRPRWGTPLWFVVGFIFIFVLGGITGVMVATAPFDAQAHDSFFVVAHFHYVLIGGVVFPIFAGLHHWLPKFSGRLPDEKMGKTAFWLMFVGFNLAFFPQHWVGLQGMVRRTYTYPAGLGWEGANLASTVGAFVLAAGILLFLGNLLYAWRRGAPSGDDPWGGDSLEWATSSPPPAHNFTQLPAVGSRSPLWHETPAPFDEEVLEALSTASRPWQGARETVRTTVVEAIPESIDTLPGPSYWPVGTASCLAVALVGVLVDAAALSMAGAAAAVVCLVGWNRERPALPQTADRSETGTQREHAHRRLAGMADPGRGAAWWGSVVGLLAVATTVGALVYAYGYLRLGVEGWPPSSVTPPPLVGPGLALALVVGAAILTIRWPAAGWARVGGAGLAVGALVLQTRSLFGSGHRIEASAYEAIVIVLEITGAVLLGVAVLVRLARRRIGPGPAEVEVELAWWRGVSILWVVLWAVVHLGARVL